MLNDDLTKSFSEQTVSTNRVSSNRTKYNKKGQGKKYKVTTYLPRYFVFSQERAFDILVDIYRGPQIKINEKEHFTQEDLFCSVRQEKELLNQLYKLQEKFDGKNIKFTEKSNVPNFIRNLFK